MAFQIKPSVFVDGGFQTNFSVVSRPDALGQGAFAGQTRRPNISRSAFQPQNTGTFNDIPVTALQDGVLTFNAVPTAATGNTYYTLPTAQQMMQAFPSWGYSGFIGPLHVLNLGTVPVYLRVPAGSGAIGDPANLTGGTQVGVLPFSTVTMTGNFTGVDGTAQVFTYGSRPIFFQLQSVNGAVGPTGANMAPPPLAATGAYAVY